MHLDKGLNCPVTFYVSACVYDINFSRFEKQNLFLFHLCTCVLSSTYFRRSRERDMDYIQPHVYIGEFCPKKTELPKER